MKYPIGIVICILTCLYIFFICKKFLREANFEILKEVKKNGYDNYKQYIKNMQKKEIKIIRKNRKRKRWQKYQKKHGL